MIRSIGNVHIVNMKSSSIVTSLFGHSSCVTHVSFSHDGAFLVSTSKDKTARLWHTTTWALVKEFISSKWIWTAAFSRNDSLLAICGDEKTVQLWDVETQQSVCALKGHEQTIVSAAFSPKRDVLVTGDCRGFGIVWDSNNFQQLGKFYCYGLNIYC